MGYAIQPNAHLIAAAPAMYEALQQSLVLVELAALEEWGREVTGEQWPPTTEARDRLEKVKAALAQAEGK
jgi:ribosomal protein S12 methylthiotransferase accessory factor YcaO